MRHAILAALLGTGALLACPTAASAHADYVSSSPGNGASITSAPSRITVKFNEPISLGSGGVRLLDGTGAQIAVTGTARGNTITIRPSSTLKPSRYAAAWHVLSDDGHLVSGASSFAVKTTSPKARPSMIPTTPAVPTRISGARVGSRTVVFDRRIKSGMVEWTTSRLSEPLTWKAYSAHAKGKSVGILPFAGTWSMKATLYTGTAVIVVTGSTYVAP